MGALAEFERDLISERTKAGMKATKKRGKHIGRPKALSKGQVQHMHELLKQGKTQGEVAELLGVSSNTIGRETVQTKKNTKVALRTKEKIMESKMEDKWLSVYKLSDFKEEE